VTATATTTVTTTTTALTIPTTLATALTIALATTLATTLAIAIAGPWSLSECVRRAKQGQDLLNELNNTLTSAASAFFDPIINPEQMPLMPPQAMHNAPYVITGGTVIGVIPMSSGQKCKKGERGPDVEVHNRRNCARCKEFGGNDWELLKYNCDGRYWSQNRCNYFDKDGRRK
jgi:hypothetical protein